MAVQTLKIIQHNVRAWTHNRRNELYNIYRTEDPDLILINSHGRKTEEKIKIFNYTTYQVNYREEANDGAAIAIKKHIPHEIIDNLEENYLAMTIQTTLGPVCIATGYQPPRRPRIPIQNIINITRRNMPVYFLGDLNARHQIFNHRTRNASGRMLHDLIQEGRLTHLGPDFQTFISGANSGTPDVILGHTRNFHNIHIKPGSITTSDHLPVIMKISTSPIQTPVPPRYNLKHANWEAFQADLTNTPAISLHRKPAIEINAHMENWFSTVTTAMEKHIPRTRHKTLPHPRLSDETRNIQAQYTTLQRQAQENQWTRERRHRFTVLQTQLQQICKQEQEAHWDSLIANTEAEYSDPAKFWRNIKRLLGNDQQHIPYIEDDQGNKYHKEADQEREFRRFWSKIYEISEEENRDFCQETQNTVEEYLHQHAEEYSPYDTIDLTRLTNDNQLIKPISLTVIAQTIKQFKNKKAPGISRINKEILAKLPENILKNLQEILNASLSAGLFPDKFKTAILKFIPKGNKKTTKVQNHRPISLLEAVGKTYEKIVNDRLRTYQETNELNNPHQHSYRKRRGTHTALALLYEEIAVSQRNKEQCNIVLRDVAKAFDKVYHAGLKYKIAHMNIPRCFKALLCNFLDDRSAKIQIGHHLGEEFQLKSGVPQGSCLSPTLYNLYVADLGTLRNGNYIQYADDITQIIRYEGRSKEMCKRKTEAAIEEVNKYEQKWKIKTNVTKFQILHPSNTKPRNIEKDGRNIHFTREARVLGLKLNRTGFQVHINERKRLAQVALGKIKRFRKMQPRTKLHLYKAMVAPHLTYPPVPLNIIAHTNILRLQAEQNKALRWINGDSPPYHTTIQALHTKYNLEPLNIKLHKAATRVWETLRTHQEEEVQRLLEEDRGGTHRWWKTAYQTEDEQPPQAVYCHTRTEPEDSEGTDNED